MRNRMLITTLSIFMALAFAAPSLTEAQWKTNSVVNQTTDPLYVVYSTWYGQSQGLPRGYRTRGYYKVDPGNLRTFQAWANNAIYFQIWQSGETLKPQANTETFSFWVHPSRAFVVVSPRISETVTQGQLTHSRPGRNTLVGEDGFMRYANGSELKVDGSWVRVSGIAETDPGAELSLDVNNDGVIDASDVAYVASRLGRQGTSADVNGDGRVTVLDVQLVTDALGTQVDRGGGMANGTADVPTTVTPTPQRGVTQPAQQITTQPDGRTMVLIPAGEFQMGSNDPESDTDEQPIHTVYVDAFYMDTHEVTNLDFKRFVLENPQWQKSRIPKSLHNGTYLHHWDDNNNYPAGKANHPVVYVSWYAAVAYSKWSGKRLPTEAEWEKAARGGLKGMKYPWGNTISSVRANYGSNVGDTTVVGRYPANGYGLYDMSGNVWEWCLDAYNPDFYFSSPSRNPLSDVNTLSNLNLILDDYTNVKSRRVLRGGSWSNSTRSVRVASRSSDTPSGPFTYPGFRCARAVFP